MGSVDSWTQDQDPEKDLRRIYTYKVINHEPVTGTHSAQDQSLT